MKAYRVSIAEYNFIQQEIKKSSSGIIVYDGHIFQDIGDKFCEAIICASQKDVISGNYEWMQVITPFDVNLFLEV